MITVGKLGKGEEEMNSSADTSYFIAEEIAIHDPLQSSALSERYFCIPQKEGFS